MSSARRAWDPLPDTAPISAKVASTPATVSDGSGAACGRERSDAQPTPIWRCRSSPDSHDTMIATCSGSAAARRSNSAMCATLIEPRRGSGLRQAMCLRRREGARTQLGMARRQLPGADTLACLRNVTDLRDSDKEAPDGDQREEGRRHRRRVGDGSRQRRTAGRNVARMSPSSTARAPTARLLPRGSAARSIRSTSPTSPAPRRRCRPRSTNSAACTSW